MQNRKSLTVFSAFIWSCAIWNAGILPAGAETFVGEALRPYVESGELPGAISVVQKGDREEVTLAGYADPATGRAVTLDDAFMQCSQTKGFCGVTIAMLVEEGKIALDDPVSKYLPEFREVWVRVKKGINGGDLRLKGDSFGDDDAEYEVLRKAKTPITIRMCMNHTAGFPFEIPAKQPNIPSGGWTGGMPIRSVAATAASRPLEFEPGARMLYSNTGIDIGAAVVEVVTGKKWEAFLKERVLEPLGMDATTFWPTDAQLAGRIQLYQYRRGERAVLRGQDGWEQEPFNDAHVFASAGAGLWTTTRDQLKFYRMLMNLGLGDNGVRILKEETVRELLALNGENGYSLGLRSGEWFGHGGAWGTNCMVNWKKKELKLWVVQLTEAWNQEWQKALEAAENRFFEAAIDHAAEKEFTGRIGE